MPTNAPNSVTNHPCHVEGNWNEGRPVTGPSYLEPSPADEDRALEDAWREINALELAAGINPTPRPGRGSAPRDRTGGGSFAAGPSRPEPTPGPSLGMDGRRRRRSSSRLDDARARMRELAKPAPPATTPPPDTYQHRRYPPA